MPKIRFRTMTMNAWRITAYDADIVQHGCCLQELTVYIPLRMPVGYLQCTVSHLTVMFQQQPPQLIVLRIIPIYNTYVIHTTKVVQTERNTK